MTKAVTGIFILVVFGCCSCRFSRSEYSPHHKISKEVLQKDFRLLQDILESKHPSLYWYTPKAQMDEYFSQSYRSIGDSMTEPEFVWTILAPLINKIHCGHTSVGMSKAYFKWARGKPQPGIPFYAKVWNDTMVLTYNRNKSDTILKRGTIITSIDGRPVNEIMKTIFGHISQDGYVQTNQEMAISADFPYYYNNIFGEKKEYRISYKDSMNNEKTVNIGAFLPPADSLNHKKEKAEVKSPKPRSGKTIRQRSFEIDSTKLFAVMRVNTFSSGGLRTFFRRSFRRLKKDRISNLIIDLRINGGGRVAASTLLTKYISRAPFKVADTISGVSQTLSPYTRHISGKFFNNLEMMFICKKNKDGRYHINHLENKIFYPKKKNHYNGKVYVLTGGPTFSASCLFTNVIKGQKDILLVGEETGGGWYGNNGIMIPDIMLPRTGVRVRLPLFRLIQYRHPAVKGTGVIPDWYIAPDYEAVKKSFDKKLKTLKEMIYSQERSRR